MSSTPRVNTLTEGNDLLKVLSEFLKNPKLMAELESEVIKINTLSAEEEGRLHECKILMQQKDELEKTTAAQRKTLAAEKAAHDDSLKKTQDKCDDYVAAEEKKITDKKEAQDAREADLNDYSLRLDQRENQLKEKAAIASSLF